MTELEWLKQESGLNDEELKAYESILGDGKFKTMLKKVIDANSAMEAAKTKAEGELEQFTTRYQSEFVPALRDAAQQAILADSKRAAAEAKLSKAKELGIVVDEPSSQDETEPRRAPGSPSPNTVTRDDLGRFEQSQADVILAVQDLNAEHFGLFGAPLGNTQDLVAQVRKHKLLGNNGYTLKNAWEEKYNVPAKREEIKTAAQKKHDEEIISVALKAERERSSANPNLRRGQPSRFDRYKSSEASTGSTKPWEAAHSPYNRNREWRDKAVSTVRNSQAA